MVSPLNKKGILHLESCDVIHFILVALFIYSFHFTFGQNSFERGSGHAVV